ncbi:MAG: family 10 glycosylhydrolase [Chloroflexi bacterium]|nr:family 10 glycosylhydrolase [Chloroflexota bacterium]
MRRPTRPGLLAGLLLLPLVVTTALAASQLPAPSVARAEANPSEVRALWVDAFHDGIKTPSQVRKLVADARRANVNTLLVQVRRRGDLYYPGFEPMAADIQPGFDPLRAVIQAAHEDAPRLEVQAWLATYPVWSDRYNLPPWPQHLYHTHGPATSGPANWLMMRDDGEVWGEGLQLDPGHPDVSAYLVSLAADLVQRYDVDGVHLDRVRYNEGDAAGGGAWDRRWGYNPVSVGLFNDANGRSGIPDPNDPRWMDWRRDRVTDYVRRTRDAIKSVRPDLKLTASVIPWGAGPATDADWVRMPAYAYVFQDWRSWLEQGLIDQAYVMNYNRESSPQQAGWLDRWLSFERRNTNDRQVIPGLAAYLNSPAETIRQIRRATTPAPDGSRLAGVALYSYAVPDLSRSNNDPSDDLPDDALWSALTRPTSDNGFQPPFAQPAGIPTLSSSAR